MKQYSIFDECFVDSFAGGGVWYTVTSKVDTVLITAEFGRKP